MKHEWRLAANGWYRFDEDGNYSLLSHNGGLSLSQVQRYIRNHRNFNYAVNDTFRYW